MFQKIILVVFIVALYPYGLIFANLEINEVMYDLEGSDDDREWIELYNNGEASIDLSEYRFSEGGVNHKLVFVEGAPRLDAFQYAVIVSDPDKFKSDHANFTGNIFDSSFTLSNIGETLVIKEKNLNIIDQVIYKNILGGAGNSRTISKIEGAWREGKPTPGLANDIYIPPTPKVVSVSKPVFEKKLTPQITTSSQPVEETRFLDQGENGADNFETSGATTGSISYIPMLISLALIGAASIGVYSIRRKRIIPKAGEDFEIEEL